MNQTVDKVIHKENSNKLIIESGLCDEFVGQSPPLHADLGPPYTPCGIFGGSVGKHCRSADAGEFWKDDMNFLEIFKQYWSFMALGLWFAYKWWNSRRVVALLPELKRNGAVLVDVRSSEEFATGSAPGTINIPLPELGRRLSEIPKTSPVVLCCASGTRSGMAKLLLRKNGYSQVHNIGTWTRFLD